MTDVALRDVSKTLFEAEKLILKALEQFGSDTLKTTATSEEILESDEPRALLLALRIWRGMADSEAGSYNETKNMTELQKAAHYLAKALQ